MHKIRKYFVLFLVSSILFGTFSGCQIPADDTTTDPAAVMHTPAIGSYFGAELDDNDIPPVTTGTILSDPLTVVSWDSGRCERTSFCEYGEISTGLYGSAGYTLAYAEKTDLDNWHVVCPNPDCKHAIEPGGCPAKVGGNFIISNERIYYPGSSRQYHNR